MKYIQSLCENLTLYFFLLTLLTFVLGGCSTTKITTISVNEFYQTNYDYNCLEEDKTFSQIIICLKTQDNAEKAQNKITNDLITNKN